VCNWDLWFYNYCDNLHKFGYKPLLVCLCISLLYLEQHPQVYMCSFFSRMSLSNGYLPGSFLKDFNFSLVYFRLWRLRLGVTHNHRSQPQFTPYECDIPRHWYFWVSDFFFRISNLCPFHLEYLGMGSGLKPWILQVLPAADNWSHSRIATGFEEVNHSDEIHRNAYLKLNGMLQK